jgi:hypothetical protein
MQPFTQGDEESTVPAEMYPQLIEEAEPLRERYPELPPALDRAILACLQPDPKKRPASARDLAIALQGVLEDFRMDELLAWPRGFPIFRRERDAVAGS